MKRRILSIVLTLCMLLSFLPLIPVRSAAGDFAINETNFPDANFRNYVKTFDTNNDNVLSSAEISAVTAINVPSKNISDLTGVELFTNITYLICYENQLISLDLSQNKKLTNLSCHSNQLTSLDVSKNTGLKSLDCYANSYKIDLLGDGFNLPTLPTGKRKQLAKCNR